MYRRVGVDSGHLYAGSEIIPELKEKQISLSSTTVLTYTHKKKEFFQIKLKLEFGYQVVRG